MTQEAIEEHNVSFVGNHDLDGRPGFKIGIQEVDGRWYLYSPGFWHSGWSVVDVTDPTDPELLRWVEGPENTLTLQTQVSEGLMLTSLEQPRAGRGPVDGPEPDPTAPYGEGVYIWDVETDPAHPERVGHYETGGEGTHRNFYDGGDYAYMAADAQGFDGRMLKVVDVSDPTSPEEVGEWWWPGQGPDDEEEADATYYFHGPAYVDGDRAYLAYGDIGMVTLDVSDPTDPQFLSRLDFRDLGSWLGTHSAIPVPGTDLVAVNSEAIHEANPLDEGGEPFNYVFLVDAEDADRRPDFDNKSHCGPRIVSAVPTPTPPEDAPYDSYHERPGRFGPHNQHHYRHTEPRLRTSDYLVMTWFNAGLRIFDISDPLAPTEAGRYVAGDPEERIGHPRPGTGLVSTFEDVVVDERGYIYCTDPQQGLFILESDVIQNDTA